MSQRNPMNERYTTDAKSGGSSRKSAASAKPKSNAASSVVVGSKKKNTKSSGSGQKSTKRQERERQYQVEQKYGDPPWHKFKVVKRLWIASLVCSIICVAGSFGVNQVFEAPETVATVLIIMAYVFIVLTLYLDLGQIRKMRKKWVAMMSSSQTKEGRAEQKRIKAEARAAAKEAEMKKAQEEQESAEKSNMSFGDKLKSFFTTK